MTRHNKTSEAPGARPSERGYPPEPAGVVCLDSIAYLRPEHEGLVVCCGSHGGRSAAAFAVTESPGAVLFNDAGGGKDGAGMSGLSVLQEAGLPGATVDAFTARIGEGRETYHCGIVSAVNELAAKAGVSVRQTAVDAVRQLLQYIRSRPNDPP